MKKKKSLISNLLTLDTVTSVGSGISKGFENGTLEAFEKERDKNFSEYHKSLMRQYDAWIPHFSENGQNRLRSYRACFEREVEHGVYDPDIKKGTKVDPFDVYWGLNNKEALLQIKENLLVVMNFTSGDDKSKKDLEKIWKRKS